LGRSAGENRDLLRSLANRPQPLRGSPRAKQDCQTPPADRLSPTQPQRAHHHLPILRPGELVGPLAAAKRALRNLARRIQALGAELKDLMANLDGLNQAA